jgi:predicted nucleic acid-binding protein
MATEGVLDSSVIVSLVVPEEFSDWSDNVMKEYKSLSTLELSYYEVTNALRNKVMQRELPKAEASGALVDASELISRLELHEAEEVIFASFNLATELNISVYDAAFLNLAKKHRSKLITLDTKFAKKIKGTPYYNILVHPPIQE